MHPLQECLCQTRRQFLTSTAGGIGLAAQASKLLKDVVAPDVLARTRFAFAQKDTAVLLGTRRTFKQYGQSGMWFSDVLPNIARHADRICMLNAVGTSQFNHHPGQLVMQ